MFRNTTINQLALRLFGLAMLGLLLWIQVPAARAATEQPTVIESVSWTNLLETDGSVCPDWSSYSFDLPFVVKNDNRYGFADNLLTAFISSHLPVNSAGPHLAHFIRPPPFYHS